MIMDIFSRNKLLLRLVIVLIVINVFFIGFLWWQNFCGHKKPPPPRNSVEISEILKEKLQLTDQQADQLKKIRETFFTKEWTTESNS